MTHGDVIEERLREPRKQEQYDSIYFLLVVDFDNFLDSRNDFDCQYRFEDDCIAYVMRKTYAKYVKVIVVNVSLNVVF